MKLLVTDSYYNILKILKQEMGGKKNDIDSPTLIFCEEKISLLVESAMCEAISGSFSTQVYSFGNYTRLKTNNQNVLSKEGSIMAITKLLKNVPLNCFSKSRKGMASSIYDLIVQLKSSKISQADISDAIDNTDGILKNKLIDIREIYTCYEKFIEEENYNDQSSVLEKLPSIFENDTVLGNTDVYLVGYTSLTKQALNAISVLLKKARSVTAILTEGKNSYAFVNEVSELLIKECGKLNIKTEKIEKPTKYNLENKLICDYLFNPSVYASEFKQIKTDRIFNVKASDEREELENVGMIIKSLVMKNSAKYSDFTVAVNDSEKIKYSVKNIFSLLEIPYFLDTKKDATDTALVKLVLSYIEVYRHNMERSCVCNFLDNPLFSLDSAVRDNFKNYLYKYNINYNRFKEPFTFKEKEEDLELYDKIRAKLVDIFSNFNPRKMFEKLNIIDNQNELTLKLKEYNYNEEASVNEQIYDAVLSILDEMDRLLGKDISPLEFRDIFLSGVSSLKLSILPQYKDAVFIGNFKEAGQIQNKYVFALELDSGVPNVSSDVSILSDSDISTLENIKLLIEPKIRIVNHRSRENVTMLLSAFSEKLFLCSPNTDKSGKQVIKSEVFSYFEKLFPIPNLEFKDRYLTKKQGMLSFSKDISAYIKNQISDFKDACNFYYAIKPNDTIEQILKNANRKIAKIELTGHSLIGAYSSPSALEEYASCPYKAFLERVLLVKDRDEGEVSSSKIGLILHRVFKEYVVRINEISDIETSNKIVEEIFDNVLKDIDYAKFLKDNVGKAYINRAKVEAKKFCEKIYRQYECSTFKPKYLEKDFNDFSEDSLPPIKLLNGGVKIIGTIDRIDECGDYIRVIDYKTGNVDKNRATLFNGTKLQLYLYGKVLKDKKLAGAYYMPISNDYNGENNIMFIGDSLLDENALYCQDKNYRTQENKIIPAKVDKKGITKNALNEEELSAVCEYALKVSENLALNMKEGFIPASPLIYNEYFNVCENCSFKGMCEDHFTRERNNLKVEDTTIIEAVKQGEESND